MPGLETCRDLPSNQNMLAVLVCVFWAGCPLIPGYSQEPLGDLALEGVDTQDLSPDSLVGK